MEILVDAFLAAQLRDAFFAAQTRNHYPNLFLMSTAAGWLAEYPEPASPLRPIPSLLSISSPLLRG
jgi:hypothetical protein